MTRLMSLLCFNYFCILANLIVQIQGAAPLAEGPGQAGSAEAMCGSPVTSINVYAPTVTHGEFPWVAAIFERKDTQRFLCTGSLVSDQHVVTAAHCLINLGFDVKKGVRSPEDFLVKLGFLRLSDEVSERVKKMEAGSIQVPAEFDLDKYLKSDIGIIVLERPVQFSEFIRPVCLWEGSDDISEIEGLRGMVLKWSSSKSFNVDVVPKKIRPPIVSTETCVLDHVEFRRLTSNRTICAGDKDSSGLCNGDSGGGLFLQEAGRWMHRGIVSNSLPNPEAGTCDVSSYVVYTDVAKYNSWIKRIVKYCRSTCDLNGCELPEYPKSGSYAARDDLLPPQPGDVVRGGSVLEYTCQGGFLSRHTTRVCSNGTWTAPVECRGKKTTTTESPSKSGCVLPEHPPRGSYSIEGWEGPLVPGAQVPGYTILSYSCTPPFSPSTHTAYCKEDSTWSHSPTCTRSLNTGGCPLPESYTVDYECMDSKGNAIPCGSHVPSGSTVTYQCKAYHTDENYSNYQLVCEDGSFSAALPRCVPECGTVPLDAASLIIDGQVARRSDFPWHVAVYRKNGTATNTEVDWDQVCGGSIIRNHLVISAAHCYYDPNNKRVNSGDLYSVGAGKFHRSWSHPEDAYNTFVQKVQVKEIHIPQTYKGKVQLYENDLAILELSSAIRFSDAVHPVCLQLRNDVFDRLQLRAGNTGRVPGWGLTANETSSDLLQILSPPYIAYADCVKEMQKYSFVRFLTYDKICAGFTNGSAVCKGDSGGGLVFPHQPWGAETKWYLRGVVSVSPLSADGSCTRETYTAYTRVFALRDWILQLLTLLNK